MFFEFFGVCENPFGVTPETRFLYPSHAHEEARASLSHSFQAGRGFVVLVGQPGMGKTTLLMDFLQKLKNSARIAFLFQTQCNSHDFLEQVMLEFDLGIRNESAAQLHDRLRAFLAKEHSTGKRVLVVVDEAQNLDNEVLETVRLLSDFETQRTKLLHIVLSGQPQLAEKLLSPELLQLRQRIGMICRLSALNEKETREYIEYRLMVAGRPLKDPLFSDAAYKMIGELSQGIPRNINNICFHALSIAYPLNRRVIDVDIVDEATRDIDLSKESALCSAPCVVTTSTTVNESTSTSITPTPPTPEPKAAMPAREHANTAVFAAPTKHDDTEHHGAPERFRWLQSSPAPAHPHSMNSRNEPPADLRVLTHTSEMHSATPPRGNGAMLAVPVSGYWAMQAERSAMEHRPTFKPEPANAAKEAQLKPGLSSRPQKLNAAPVEVSASDKPATREQNGSQFPWRNAVLFIISFVMLIGTLLVLWPAPRPIPVQASGNSLGDGKMQASVEANTRPHPETSYSKPTSRAKLDKQTGNNSTPNPRTYRDGRLYAYIQKDPNHLSGNADVTLAGVTPLLAMIKPLYPESAKAEGLEGTVVLDTTVDQSGKVIGTHAVSGDTQLVSAAIDAVKQWRYDPQELASKQGLIHQTVRITFTLR
jgi:TonB family protein